MAKTKIHKVFKLFKQIFPAWVTNPLRSTFTALIGPIRTAYRKGYYKSAFGRSAMSRNGKPLPWYTYPAIDFLKFREFGDKLILEFGGGQSTLWWALKAKNVITLEGDQEWYNTIKGRMPDNVDLNYVSMETMERNISEVTNVLNSKSYPKYDVIVIDGLYRYEMISIALHYMAEDGILICDNAESYGFYEGLKASGLYRIDFFGSAPGVILPHSTSIYFNPGSSFVFDSSYPIPVIEDHP